MGCFILGSPFSKASFLGLLIYLCLITVHFQFQACQAWKAIWTQDICDFKQVNFKPIPDMPSGEDL